MTGIRHAVCRITPSGTGDRDHRHRLNGRGHPQPTRCAPRRRCAELGLCASGGYGRSAHAIGQSIGSPDLNSSSAQVIDTGFFRYDKTTIGDQKIAAVRYR
jgi:hypothetical protein